MYNLTQIFLPKNQTVDHKRSAFSIQFLSDHLILNFYQRETQHHFYKSDLFKSSLILITDVLHGVIFLQRSSGTEFNGLINSINDSEWTDGVILIRGNVHANSINDRIF